MSEIILNALSVYKPKKVLLLFSGGHDSLCSTHYAASLLQSMGIEFTVYHGNTNIGIRQTREFVHDTCREHGWKLFEGHAGNAYEQQVTKYGFPGPQSHRYMYIMLKERALKRYITHACKSTPHARENILLITGIRRSESKVRMGYKEHTRKVNSAVWCSPLFDWSKEQCDAYIDANLLKRNPVREKICISGECLCGAFAKKEEWLELKTSFPEAAREIERLHGIAIESGHPWEWASNPNDYYKRKSTKKQTMFMCVGCEEKNHNAAMRA